MIRTQILTVLFVLLAGVGVAAAKPKVAVLGLEQGDRNSTKASLDGARNVTEGMRQGSRAGGQFDSMDTQRDYADEKAMAGCTPDSRDSEEKDCVKKISDTLKVGALMYGKVQLVDGKKNLQVTVWLHTVDKNAFRSTTGTVSASASPADQQALGKKLYADLAGGPAPAALGGISFRTKAQNGRVFLNGEARGEIKDGEYKSPPLADGEYKLRIEADGYKKLEDTVRVKDGKVTSIDVKLEEIVKSVKPPEPDPDEDKANRPVIGDGKSGNGSSNSISRGGTVSKGSSRTGWKVAAVSGFVMAAAGGGWWALEAYNISNKGEELNQNFASTNIKGFSLKTECDRNSVAKLAMPKDPNVSIEEGEELYSNICSSARRTRYAAAVVGVGAIIGLVGTYMGFIRSDSGSTETNASVKRARKPRFAVTPIIAPDGGGATFRLDF